MLKLCAFYVCHRGKLRGCVNEGITIKNFVVDQSLFSQNNFIVVKNISEKICEEFENFQFHDNIVIINDLITYYFNLYSK